MHQKIVIVGCGYIGTRVADIWHAHGALSITCLVRSEQKLASFLEKGFAAFAISCDQPDTITLPDVAGSILYYFVAPPGGGITDIRARNFISKLQQAQPPAKIVYMSATSVYREISGGVVTEESPTEPRSAMGKRRLDAEHAFLAYGASANVPVTILRVSGIYGPGRLPLMQIRQGQPLLREEESGPSNRIHADDLARICMIAAVRGDRSNIFNVSDGHPASMTSYFNLCADNLGYPRQPQVSLAEAHQVMSPLMLSYVTESRLVDNTKLLRELAIALKYTDMQHGIPASCVHDTTTPE